MEQIAFWSDTGKPYDDQKASGLDTSSQENLVLERQLIVALNEELRKEEVLWRTKSRVMWLTTRDLNTKFFHTSTIIRRWKNSVEFLKIEDGSWISSRDEIGTHITNYFQNLFQSSNLAIPDDLEGLIKPCISSMENDSLCAVPSTEEIWTTLNQMGSHKAPGPDVMTALFYKRF